MGGFGPVVEGVRFWVWGVVAGSAQPEPTSPNRAPQTGSPEPNASNLHS